MKIASNFWQIIKNTKQNFLPVLLCLGILVTAATAKTAVHQVNEGDNSTTPNVTFEPSATFQRMWIDYNVTQGGVKGMRIHTDFKVYNMKGIDGYLALYFQERDGTPLQDTNGEFNSANDTVAVYREIAPGYTTTVYEDYVIFMPYDELDLPGGNYQLRIDADVIYKEGGLISHLTFYNFDYNNPKTKTPTATFQRMWIDYNVTQGGVKGMRIHTDFKVYDMQGVSGYLALYFQERDGTALQDDNNSFNSSEGTVAAYREITPGYATTVYEDYVIFMPYDELDLPPGNYQLRIDADVIYKQGGLVSHLNFYNFDYNKPRR